MSNLVSSQTVAQADLPRTSWRGYDAREVDALLDRASRTLALHEGGPGRLAADVASMHAVADDGSLTDGARELARRLAEATERQDVAFVPLRAADLDGIGFASRLVGSGYDRAPVDAMLARIHAALVAHESR